MNRRTIFLLSAVLVAVGAFMGGCHWRYGRVITTVAVEEDFYLRNKPQAVSLSGVVQNTWGTACYSQVVGTTADLYRFDSSTQAWIFEERLFEDSRYMTCSSSFSWSTDWLFDRQTEATSFQVRVRSVGSWSGNSNDADSFVIWHSDGAPTGHARRVLSKLRNLARLLAEVEAHDANYQLARDLGLISGAEIVRIERESLTADEARDRGVQHLKAAQVAEGQAQYFLNAGDFQSSFDLAKEAEAEGHRAKNIHEALMAQAGDSLKSDSR